MRSLSLATIVASALACACGSDAAPTTDASTAADAAPAVECGDLPAGVASGLWGTPVPGAGPSSRVLVLMGGGSEVDDATKVFVAGARGGDVLAVRATGSVDSYTSYFSTELAYQPPPASVETLRLDDPTAAAHDAVLCRVAAAEALWLPGGDQWDYLGAWPPAFATSAVRDVATGGTSAGAMVLGAWAFTAEHGSVTSAEALAEPLGAAVSVARSPYAQPELAGWLVDTHFSERDREGRLLTFLARMPLPAFGLGLDESTAIVIADGQYRVHGSGAAWFYQVDGPARLVPGEPLSLDGIRRVARPAGSTGAWPIDVSSGSRSLRVTSGRVEP